MAIKLPNNHKGIGYYKQVELIPQNGTIWTEKQKLATFSYVHVYIFS